MEILFFKHFIVFNISKLSFKYCHQKQVIGDYLIALAVDGYKQN